MTEVRTVAWLCGTNTPKSLTEEARMIHKRYPNAERWLLMDPWSPCYARDAYEYALDQGIPVEFTKTDQKEMESKLYIYTIINGLVDDADVLVFNFGDHDSGDSDLIKHGLKEATRQGVPSILVMEGKS